MPAKYADLGKKADDLFNKGYELGKYKVECVAKSKGVEHTTKGHMNHSNNSVEATHETKMQCCKLGELKTTFTPGKDSLACELANSNPALKGAKITACFNMGLSGCPFSASSFNKVKTAWSNDKVNFNMDTNFGDKVNFDLSAAICKDYGVTIGLKSTVDYKNMSVPSKELKLNVNRGTVDYTVKTSLKNDWNCMFHNQINSKFALATAISMGSCGSSISIAGKSAGCCGSSNQFKLDNAGRLSLSHITGTSVGADLTMSASFDATNLKSGSHKIGAGMKFTF